jgi:DDE superfamily endonuclease
MPATDDDDELLDCLVVLQLLGLCVSALYMFPVSRNSSLIEQRLRWNEYCSRHQQRGTLFRRLRMRKDSFDKLVLLLVESLVVDQVAANKRGGPIIPEICVYCTLRYLAGGSYLDISDIAGISQSSLYRVVWKTISAIAKCTALRVRFPKTQEELDASIVGFVSVSQDGAISNCVGVVDGYLLRIRVPSKKEVKNVRSFFSGHYQCYGINIQAAADHQSRFIHFAFAAPGVTGDRDAIKQCSLFDLIEALPLGMCVIGDAAYQPTEHMVPVYQGVDKLNTKYDNFNFFASQCRIRVEMAFGMMQSKWGILQRPLSCSLKNMLWLVQGIARLHNFCINERLAAAQSSFDIPDGLIPHYIPSVPHDDEGDPVALDAAYDGVLDGHSYLREYMAKRVERKQLQRPGNNSTTSSGRKRRREEEEETLAGVLI